METFVNFDKSVDKAPEGIEFALSIKARIGFSMLENQTYNKYLIDHIDEFDFYEITFDF